MDNLMISSKFTNKIISTILNQIIKKKLKKNINLELEKVDISIDDSNLNFSIKGVLPRDNIGEFLDILNNRT